MVRDDRLWSDDPDTVGWRDWAPAQHLLLSNASLQHWLLMSTAGLSTDQLDMLVRGRSFEQLLETGRVLHYRRDVSETWTPFGAALYAPESQTVLGTECLCPTGTRFVVEPQARQLARVQLDLSPGDLSQLDAARVAWRPVSEAGEGLASWATVDIDVFNGPTVSVVNVVDSDRLQFRALTSGPACASNEGLAWIEEVVFPSRRPTNMQSTALASSGVRVRWTNADKTAFGFIVSVPTVSGYPPTVVTTGTSVDLLDLPAGRSHTVRVRAVTPVASSADASVAASAVPVAPTLVYTEKEEYDRKVEGKKGRKNTRRGKEE